MGDRRDMQQDSQPRVVTPEGGLLMPFLWEVDKRLRRTLTEARHPMPGLVTCATDLHTVRVTSLRGKRVLVACDLVNASFADRMLLLQLAHAATAQGAKVELHLTVPRADPAYAAPVQARMRALLHFLAPVDALVVTGEGRLDVALSRCDYLLWAHNVPDKHLPPDLKGTESFASWAAGLGIELRASPGNFTPAALARIRDHQPAALRGLGMDYVILGQEAEGLPEEERVLHVAEVARLTVEQQPGAIVALRDLQEAPPLDRVRFPSKQPAKLVQPRGLTPEEVLATVLGARVGFSLPGNLLHLGSLLGVPWYTSYDRAAPYAGWELAHYSPARLLSR